MQPEMTSSHQNLNKETYKDPSVMKLVEEDEVAGTDKRRKRSVGQDETLHPKAVVAVSTFSPNRQIEGSNNQPQDDNSSLSLGPPPLQEQFHKNKSQKLQTLKFDSVPMDSDEYARKGYRECGYVNLNLQSATNHQALSTTGMRNQLPFAMGSGVQNQQLVRSSMNQQPTAMGKGLNQSQIKRIQDQIDQDFPQVRSSMNQQPTAMGKGLNQWQIKRIQDQIDQDFPQYRQIPVAPSDYLGAREVPFVCHEDPCPFMPICCSREIPSELQSQSSFLDKGLDEVLAYPDLQKYSNDFDGYKNEAGKTMPMRNQQFINKMKILQKERMALWNQNNTLMELLGLSYSQNKILEDRLSESIIQMKEAESKGKLKYIASKEHMEDMRAHAMSMKPSVIEEFKASPAGQAWLSSGGVTAKNAMKRSRSVNTNSQKI